ncbi:MAG: helix-turn-helix domain-containing protein [Streptococcaceae bacterium]|jgi:Rgg/GadR/MutR family transcriptional activator|nr:helix-turn-helix domain-containing protein [Streptococcaceae bacterium]
MIKNKLGSVFRQLREMKNLSLSQTAEGICSKSQLSRFENGENDIGAEKLFQLLNAINITYEEFVYQIRNFDKADFERLFIATGVYEENKDFDKIEALQRQELEKPGKLHYYNALALQSILSMHHQTDMLSDAEVAEVTDYLFSILEWSRYEIWIFQAISPQLSYPLCLEFANELLNRTLFYRNVPENRALIGNCMKMIAFVAIDNHDVLSAEKYLQRYLELQGKNDWTRLIAAPLIRIRILREKGDIAAAWELLRKLIASYENFGMNPKNLQDLKDEEDELKAL